MRSWFDITVETWDAAGLEVVDTKTEEEQYDDYETACAAAKRLSRELSSNCVAVVESVTETGLINRYAGFKGGQYHCG